jgi:DnaK suppressor protein
MNGPQPLLDPTFIASQRQRLEVIRAKVSDAVDHGVDEDLDLALNARNNASETEDRAQESTISDNNRILNGDLVRYRSSIDRALAKIDEGTYGLSDESGLPIPAERLNAYPQATRTASEEARHLNTLQIR